MFFLFLEENICYGNLLEEPHQGTSNEYAQHVFFEKLENMSVYEAIARGEVVKFDNSMTGYYLLFLFQLILYLGKILVCPSGSKFFPLRSAPIFERQLPICKGNFLYAKVASLWKMMETF